MKTKKNKGTIKKTTIIAEITKNIRIITTIYLVTMFTVFPFYYDANRVYYNMSTTKLAFFFFATYTSLAVILILLCIYVFTHFRDLPVLFRNAIKHLSITDKFVLLYVAAITISFLLSSYKSTAFWGLNKWQTGLVTLLLLCTYYFLVSRNIQLKPYLIYCILGASFCVNAIASLQHLGVNVLNLYSNHFSFSNKMLYLSTIGNCNWLAIYFCTIFPLGAFLYCRASSKWESRLLALYVVIGGFTMIAMNADSVFLGMAGMFLFILWFSFGSYAHMKRFCYLLLMCLVSFRIYGLLDSNLVSESYLTNLQYSISRHPIIYVLILIVCLVYSIVHFCEEKNVSIQAFKKSRLVLYIIFGALFIALIAIFILINTTDLLSGYSALQNNSYLIFNDAWGSRRGGAWQHCVDVFRNFPITEKLFGVGPDCFYEYSRENYNAYISTWSSRLTNAHSEFFTNLVTIGLIGSIAYFGIYISSIVTAIRNMRIHQNPVPLGFSACIVAYMCNSVVSFQHVTGTPLLFLMIALSEAIRRNPVDNDDLASKPAGIKRGSHTKRRRK